MADAPEIVTVAPGTFRVTVDGRYEIVYVAGPSGNRWAFWSGEVFPPPVAVDQSTAPRRTREAASASLSAPMPATVLKVLVAPGSRVKKGDTLVILEAMKMELPIRSPSDGTVATLACREGELVKADQTLLTID